MESDSVLHNGMEIYEVKYSYILCFCKGCEYFDTKMNRTWFRDD